MPHNFCLGWITRIQNLENSRNTAYLYQMNRAKTTNLGNNAWNYLIPIKIQARNRSNFGSNGLTNSFSITKSCLHWIYRYFVTTKVSLRNAVFSSVCTLVHVKKTIPNWTISKVHCIRASASLRIVSINFQRFPDKESDFYHIPSLYLPRTHHRVLILTHCKQFPVMIHHKEMLKQGKFWRK